MSCTVNMAVGCEGELGGDARGGLERGGLSLSQPAPRRPSGGGGEERLE